MNRYAIRGAPHPQHAPTKKTYIQVVQYSILYTKIRIYRGKVLPIQGYPPNKSKPSMTEVPPIFYLGTLPKTNSQFAPDFNGGWEVGKLLSFLLGFPLLSGGILVSGRVIYLKFNLQIRLFAKILYKKTTWGWQFGQKSFAENSASEWRSTGLYIFKKGKCRKTLVR